MLMNIPQSTEKLRQYRIGKTMYKTQSKKNSNNEMVSDFIMRCSNA